MSAILIDMHMTNEIQNLEVDVLAKSPSEDKRGSIVQFATAATIESNRKSEI